MYSRATAAGDGDDDEESKSLESRVTVAGGAGARVINEGRRLLSHVSGTCGGGCELRSRCVLLLVGVFVAPDEGCEGVLSKVAAEAEDEG